MFFFDTFPEYMPEYMRVSNSGNVLRNMRRYYIKKMDKSYRSDEGREAVEE